MERLLLTRRSPASEVRADHLTPDEERAGGADGPNLLGLEGLSSASIRRLSAGLDFHGHAEVRTSGSR
jgi:hypothetical protein